MNDPAAVTISGAHTLSIIGAGVGRRITISGGAGLTTINSNLLLGGLSQGITVNNAAGLVINGIVGGTIGLIKAGTGHLTLTAVETYTGSTLITADTLQIGNGLTGSIAAVSPVAIIGGTLALNLVNGGLFANNVVDNNLLTTIATGSNTLSGVISGTGGFTQNGTGVTILTGANTYTAATTVLQGTLQIGHSRAMMLIVIFCIGKIDRSSNKDGSDYEQSRP